MDIKSEIAEHESTSCTEYVGPFNFEGGDIRAKAYHNGVECIFNVSSHALSFASPVWRKMIVSLRTQSSEKPETPSEDGDAAPKRPRADEEDHINRMEIDFLGFTDGPGADAALLILLNIAHLKFSGVPEKLPDQVLFAIAMFTSRFECRKLIRPWLKAWMKPVEWFLDEDYIDNAEKWLCITLNFGQEDSFVRLSRHYVIHANATGSSLEYLHVVESLFRNNFEIIAEELAGTILESITKARKKLVDEILKSMYKFTYEYENSKHVLCLSSSTVCDALNYGVFTTALREQNLWPRKDSSDIEIPIIELVNHVNTVYKQLRHMIPQIEWRSDSTGGMQNLNLHRRCSYEKITFDIKAIIYYAPRPVSEPYLRLLSLIRKSMEL